MTPRAADLNGVFRLVGERTGLQFPPYRQDAAARTVRAAMGRAGTTDPAAFVDRLRTDPAALDHLVGDLTIGETYFFREPGQFDLIRREVVPDVLARRPRGAFRVWSAACATGEEAYSLAALFVQAGLTDGLHLLATDLSLPALARARQGVYRDWSIRGLEGQQAAPFLRRVGGAYVVDDRVRRLVRFAPLNLAAADYPSAVTGTDRMDLILCRNVLIYFDPRTIRAVARRLHDSLAPGGWLFTGSCDPPLAGLAPFVRVVTPSGVVYRRELEGAERLRPLNPSPQPPPLRREGGQVQVAEGGGVSSSSPPLSKEGPGEGLSRPPTTAEEADRVRALAATDPDAADRLCAEAADRHPLSTELYLLHAAILAGAGRPADAVRVARRALFLDPSLAVAHLTLGTLLDGLGDPAGARRAFRAAKDLAAGRPADEPVPLGEGETAGAVVAAADAHLALLDTRRGATP